MKEALEELGLDLNVIEDQEPELQRLETAVLAVLLPVFWIPYQRWATGLWLRYPLQIRYV